MDQTSPEGCPRSNSGAGAPGKARDRQGQDSEAGQGHRSRLILRVVGRGVGLAGQGQASPWPIFIFLFQLQELSRDSFSEGGCWQRGREEGSFFFTFPQSKLVLNKTPPFASSYTASIPREESGCSPPPHTVPGPPHTLRAHRYWGASTSGRCGPHAPASGDLKYRFPHESQKY